MRIIEAERPAASEPLWREALMDAGRILDATPVSALDVGVLLDLNRHLLPASNPHRGEVRTGRGSIRLDGMVHRELPPPAVAFVTARQAMCALAAAVAGGAAMIKPVETAVEVVFQLSCAHLFVDGNGRIARAVGNWLLVRAGYELVGDPRLYCRERIHAYYSALDRAEGGDMGEWREFFPALVATCYRESAVAI